jgi:hypothetical protein
MCPRGSHHTWPTAHRVRLTKIKQISCLVVSTCFSECSVTVLTSHVHLLWYKCKQRPAMHTVNIVCICTIVQKCSYLLILLVTALKCGPSYFCIYVRGKVRNKTQENYLKFIGEFHTKYCIYQQRKFSIFFD